MDNEMDNYFTNKSEILNSLHLGKTVEEESIAAAVSLTDEQINWISAWLAGEGFSKID